ncbi:hypothetical protein HGO34_26715 [Agrobacterium vitis]|uniref:Uncharacterized protein n=1 Tax=Agrobacterium vitis TaxID=373 RepID=A0AAE5AYN6_AGRVI|nr:hypothetical protein [Agrobacterium vitis]MCF1501797.1 hypothetical protein [Allorhizobium sp. Av2]MCM2443299.1 hypothetical protein [Agrobacterium vitis]MUZ60939.1 hypothetical protein [Agrobacterium vitis]MVA69203.1 hypothetical protein [Agrobacterium vitis]
MAPTTQFNPLRLVNDAINNANLAGQTLTPDAIALLWKLAQGKLSEGDAAELSRTLREAIVQKRERHEVRVVDKETAAALDAIAATLCEIRGQLVTLQAPASDTGTSVEE